MRERAENFLEFRLTPRGESAHYATVQNVRTPFRDLPDNRTMIQMLLVCEHLRVLAPADAVALADAARPRADVRPTELDAAARIAFAATEPHRPPRLPPMPRRDDRALRAILSRALHAAPPPLPRADDRSIRAVISATLPSSRERRRLAIVEVTMRPRRDVATMARNTAILTLPGRSKLVA